MQFEAGLAEVLRQPDAVLLEIGPGKTLAALAHAQGGRERLVASSLGGGPEQAGLLSALGELWLSGMAVDEERFWRRERRRRVPAPLYPFARERCWVDSPRGHRPAAAEDAAIARHAEVGEWFYLPYWRPAPPPPAPAAERLAGGPPWLIYTDAAGIGERLADRLRHLGQKVTTVVAARGARRPGKDELAIDPGSAADCQELFAELARRRATPGRIVHLWTLGPPAADAAAPDPARPDCGPAAANGMASLLALGRALSGIPGAPLLILDVVSSGVQSVLGEALDPEKAAVIGPCMVLPQELPNLACRHIDLELPARRGEARFVERLLAELTSPARQAGDSIIAWRGSRRFVQDFQPVSVPPPAPAAPVPERSRPPAGLRRRGVYLLTGGLGRIGLVLAAVLAREADARLVLASRTRLPERPGWTAWLAAHEASDPVSRKLRQIEEVEALGAEVVAIEADVADPAQARALVELALARFGTLHGVIHAAGEQRAIAAEATLTADVQALLRPKLGGALALDAALAGRELDFRLLFSSLSAVLGGLGFAAYAAANVALDAFARESHRRGRERWTSVDWDAWRFPGEPAAARVADVNRPEQAELAMTTEEGSVAFLRLLALAGEVQVVVSTGDLAARRRRWLRGGPAAPARAAAAVGGGARHPRPALRHPYRPPSTGTERAIAEVWSRLLGVEPIGLDDDFFELGGDSLIATQLVFDLRRTLLLEVPLQRLFATSTVAGIAALAAAEGVAGDELEQLLDEIESLSPEELEALGSPPVEHPAAREDVE